LNQTAKPTEINAQYETQTAKKRTVQNTISSQRHTNIDMALGEYFWNINVREIEIH